MLGVGAQDGGDEDAEVSVQRTGRPQLNRCL